MCIMWTWSSSPKVVRVVQAFQARGSEWWNVPSCDCLWIIGVGYKAGGTDNYRPKFKGDKEHQNHGYDG